MKFEEVLPALRARKKITSEYLRKCGYQYIYYQEKTVFDNKGGYWHLTNCEIVERDDWEIVKEPKKVKVKLRDLTEEQYKKWVKNNHNTHHNCKDCLFDKVYCAADLPSCWIKNKNLYSDKFLDQEIEIEE